MSKLPEDLKCRIVTTSAEIYMRHYGLDYEEFDLISIATETLDWRLNSLPEVCNLLYKKMALSMIELKAVAVTEVKISDTAAAVDWGSTRTIMYGTAIVPRKTE